MFACYVVLRQCLFIGTVIDVMCVISDFDSVFVFYFLISLSITRVYVSNNLYRFSGNWYQVSVKHKLQSYKVRDKWRK